MRKEKMILLLVTGVLTISLGACNTEENKEAESKKISGENINEIYVETVGENVQLYSTSEKEIKMNNIKNIEIKEEKKKLKIQADNSSIINLKTDTVKIYLPQKIFEQITVKTESGNILAKDITSKQLNINSDSSDMEIKDYKGERVKGVSKSGGIQLQGVEGEFDLQSDTGEVTVSKIENLQSESKVKTESANINISLNRQLKNIKLDVSAQAGKIKDENSLLKKEKGNREKLIVESMTGTVELRCEGE